MPFFCLLCFKAGAIKKPIKLSRNVDVDFCDCVLFGPILIAIRQKHSGISVVLFRLLHYDLGFFKREIIWVL